MGGDVGGRRGGGLRSISVIGGTGKLLQGYLVIKASVVIVTSDWGDILTMMIVMMALMTRRRGGGRKGTWERQTAGVTL